MDLVCSSTTVFRISFLVSLLPHAVSKHPPQQKHGCLVAFVSYRFTLTYLIFFNEFNYLRSLAVFQEYNSSVIRKILNKFKSLKRFTCHWNEPCGNFVVLTFYSFISCIISKILSRFSFKVSLRDSIL